MPGPAKTSSNTAVDLASRSRIRIRSRNELIRLPDIHQQISRLLRGPGAVRVDRRAEHMYVAGRDLHDEQDVQPVGAEYCVISCDLGVFIGSGSRGGFGAGRAHRSCRQVGVRARRAGSAAAPGAADGCCSGRRTRSGRMRTRRSADYALICNATRNIRISASLARSDGASRASQPNTRSTAR